MYAIFSSKLLVFVFIFIFTNSCTDYADKSKILTDHGPALAFFHKHYLEFERIVGRKPISIDEVFQRLPNLKSEFESNYSNDISIWVYYKKSNEGILIEVNDDSEGEKLFLIEGGHLIFR